MTNQHLVAELNRFETFAEMRGSEFYRQHKTALDSLLKEPILYAATEPQPRLRRFLRVVVWNIERGAQFAGILHAFTHHPILRYADLLLLNELDDGMVRSGYRNVARELGEALAMHAIYGAEYLELTKGTGAEITMPGENTVALHGNAILTRYPFSAPQLVRLPRCENNYESTEKRLGGRRAILLTLRVKGRELTLAVTHLDVVNTPRCRARQMRAVLEALEASLQTDNEPNGKMPTLIGGDWNTHTFARGTRLRTIKNVIRIFGSPPKRLVKSLLDPLEREPALREVVRSGYELESLNDGKATSRSIVSSLEDANRLPFPLRGWVKRRLRPEGLLLEFRLDWLAARGLRGLRENEAVDEATGVASVAPQTISGLAYSGVALSDHDPIVADFAIDE